MLSIRDRDVLYMQADCVYRHSKLRGISLSEVVVLFTKYHIFDYIEQCFDYLHLSGPEYIVDDIAERIAGGVDFVVCSLG